MKNTKGLASSLFGLSLVAFILAVLVSLFSMNLWLAGTQWMLVAVILAVYANYLNCREAHKND
ncbi:hypothetical protein J7J13_03890 [bacterium]|nr:hypothetical protein [bacterium]